MPPPHQLEGITDAQRQWLALSDERDLWRAYADLMWRQAYAAGVADTLLATSGGRCPTHAQDVADAFTAGQQAGRNEPVFLAGWNACLDRFTEEIGSRSAPAHPTEEHLRSWTRHSPRCVRGGHGGRYYCKRAGCIPGTRAEYGQPAPWDKPTPEQAAAFAASRARAQAAEQAASERIRRAERARQAAR